MSTKKGKDNEENRIGATGRVEEGNKMNSHSSDKNAEARCK